MINVTLKELAEKNNYSLNWVATKIGITYSALHRFANNKTSSISYETLDKICELFDCDVCDILKHIKE